MFVDEAIISVQAGKGGDGSASFRHEKYIPKGGPDGGDGGDGGNIYIQTDNNIDTLSYYSNHKQFKAENGQKGKNKKMHGKNGQDLILKVPLGTIIYETIDNAKHQLCDLIDKNQQFIIAKGGKGGLGNVHFKSSTNQAPRDFTYGQKGEKKQLFLQMSLIADIGLVGFPNAGKSTIVNLLSNCNSKTGNYPFTTVIPHLGVLKHKNDLITIADIPGIIENASKGKGLGIKFLQHIKRTRAIIFVLDATSKDIVRDYQILHKEMDNFDQTLTKKPYCILVNKIDLLDNITLNKLLKSKFKNNKDIIYFSSINNPIIQKIINCIDKLLNNA